MTLTHPRSPDAAASVDLSDPAEVEAIERYVAERGGSIFQRPAWLKAVERGTGQKATGLVARYGGRLSGWLPLGDVHSPFFGRALVSSPFAVGGGALADSDLQARALCEAAQELALRNSASTVEVRGGTAPGDWQAQSDSHANFIRELAEDDEAQLLAIPRKARAEIRKGLANDLEVDIGSGERERAEHYAVYAESVRNLGTPVFPRSLFAEMLDAFPDGADILTIRHQGRPVSSVFSFYHDGAVMPYWGGGTRAARSLNANERMYYELMCQARRRGCDRFDFGRSKTGGGPYRFKKNWGFEPEPLTYYSWSQPGVAARNIDPTDKGNAAKVELWKRLPLPVANALGPLIARGLG